MCATSSASPRTQGRRWSWGYPACPDQSEHEKVWRLLDAPSIGMRLSGGYAVEPEQSTVAILSHHPQAVYFGMKSGFLPKEGKVSADEVIADTARDPRKQALPPDDFAEDAGDDRRRARARRGLTPGASNQAPCAEHCTDGPAQPHRDPVEERHAGERFEVLGRAAGEDVDVRAASALATLPAAVVTPAVRDGDHAARHLVGQPDRDIDRAVLAGNPHLVAVGDAQRRTVGGCTRA